jgi:hypothetical protein
MSNHVRTLDELLRRTAERPTLALRPPELLGGLYHYTGADGALGIISTGQVWATDAAYLNDPSETIYGRDLITEVWSTIEQGMRNDIRDFIGGFVRVLCRDMSEAYSTYVSCFSEKPDLLSQWRAYGLQGTGFSLGFDPKGLAKNARGFLLAKVEYDRNTQQQGVSAFFQEVVEMFDGVNVSEIEGSELTVYEWMESELLRFVVSCKNPAYDEEQEWRLVRLRFDEVS